MQITKKQLNPHQIELTIRLEKSDALPHLTAAAGRLSQHHPIKGFRPGKAPLEVALKTFGEPAIREEALEDMINDSFQQAIDQEKINTYGKIDFDLVPILAPTEIASYKATVTVAPTATLGDWKSSKIKRQPVEIKDDELAAALDELAVMLTKEEPVDRPAAKGDKVNIDFEVSVDGKVIDGGKANDFGLILGEGKMIPGFEENIEGRKAGEEINFTQNFPADYHASDLSGKPAEFKIKLNQVFVRVKPTADDELAKRVGVQSLDELKTALKENIKREKTEREEERVEIAAIKQVVDTAKFSDIPPVMIADSVEDLVKDFEHTLAHRGMKLENYLQTIKKTIDDVKKDFEPKALERIKSSLALGQLAEDEKISVTAEEVKNEIEYVKKNHDHSHHDHNHSHDEYETPAYRRHVATALVNRKIINHIRENIIE